jgi:carbon-monoxide dehydrogenase small subunit
MAADTLAELLRDQIGLIGTKVSCEVQVCGVCTVLLNGAPVSACTVLALEARGGEVSTIEGLEAPDGSLSRLQHAFWCENALQCGFCTPGMLMTATALLQEVPHPDTATIRHWLEGSICRCTGYLPILRAIECASAESDEACR